MTFSSIWWIKYRCSPAWPLKSVLNEGEEVFILRLAHRDKDKKTRVKTDLELGKPNLKLTVRKAEIKASVFHGTDRSLRNSQHQVPQCDRKISLTWMNWLKVHLRIQAPKSSSWVQSLPWSWEKTKNVLHWESRAEATDAETAGTAEGKSSKLKRGGRQNGTSWMLRTTPFRHFPPPASRSSGGWVYSRPETKKPSEHLSSPKEKDFEMLNMGFPKRNTN